MLGGQPCRRHRFLTPNLVRPVGGGGAGERKAARSSSKPVGLDRLSEHHSVNINVGFSLHNGLYRIALKTALLGPGDGPTPRFGVKQ